jgi:hypothetical protein
MGSDRLSFRSRSPLWPRLRSHWPGDELAEDVAARGVGTAYLTLGGGGKLCYTRLRMTGQRHDAGYVLGHWWRFSFSKTHGGSPAWVPA